jgi:hypothetical protein
MFADDLLLFGEATEEQVRCMVDTVNRFCSLSEKQVMRRLVFSFPVILVEV